MNILANTQATLDVVFSAGDADGTVTVTVVDAAGTTVTSGDATLDTGTAGRYTFPLPPQPQVAALTVTWAGAWGGVSQQIDTEADIVGAHLFTLAELRDFADQALADTATYPDSLLSQKRDEIAEFFERECHVSFIPRYRRDRLAGDGSTILWLPKPRVSQVFAVSIDDVALDAASLALVDVDEDGQLHRAAGWPWSRNRNILVEYEHGWRRPPAKINEAAKLLARYELVSRDINDRAISLSNDLGTVRLSVPGQNYPTGIPTVDAALSRYQEQPVMVS